MLRRLALLCCLPACATDSSDPTPPCTEGWEVREVGDGDASSSGRYSSLVHAPDGTLHLLFRITPGSHGAAAYATRTADDWTLVSGIAPDFGGDVDDVALAVSGAGGVHATAYDVSRRELLYADLARGTTAEVVATQSSAWGLGLAVDASGAPHAVFHHRVDSDDVLRYATRSATGWTFEDIDRDDASSGYHPALVLDDGGRAHAIHGRFGPRYTTNASGAWTTEIVDTEGEQGRIARAADGTIHIVYTTGEAVRYAVRDLQGAWHLETIEEAASKRDGTGTWGAALALAAGGDVHVSYYVRHEAADDRRVAVRHVRKRGGTWQRSTIAVHTTSDRDYETSLALDAAGTVHVIFHDGHAQHARQTTCTP